MWDDSEELEGSSSSSESPETSTDEECVSGGDPQNTTKCTDLHDTAVLPGLQDSTAKPTDLHDVAAPQDTAEHMERTPGVAKLLNTEKGGVATGARDVVIEISDTTN